jgi:hypothetical protein
VGGDVDGGGGGGGKRVRSVRIRAGVRRRNRQWNNGGLLSAASAAGGRQAAGRNGRSGRAQAEAAAAWIIQ